MRLTAALALALIVNAQLLAQRPADAIPATGGDNVITPIAHGTVHLKHGSTVVLVDPTMYGGWEYPR